MSVLILPALSHAIICVKCCAEPFVICRIIIAINIRIGIKCVDCRERFGKDNIVVSDIVKPPSNIYKEGNPTIFLFALDHKMELLPLVVFRFRS